MTTTQRHASGVEETDPDTFTTAMVGVIGSILVVTAVVFLQGLYDREERAENRRKVVEETPLELHTLRVRQQERLATTAWVDPAAGVVSIPIGRAMDLVVHDPTLKAVPPPAPPPAAAPAPQAAPPAKKP